MRLIDADAYIDEINKRIKEAYIWYDEVQTDEVKARAEQAIATFCEASLTAKKMPSAEPEIVRCKDCQNDKWCSIQEAAMAGDEFFCGRAERRVKMVKKIQEKADSN